jgi:tetratricopeptide (TPR) repeat protein
MHAFDQAIQMLESLASQEQTISDELAHACNNKGFVLDELHQYSKALAFYDKAIEIWQRLIDQEQMTENIPHLLAACNNKAFALLNLNRSDEAIRWCDKAIGIGKQNWTLPPDGMALLSKELSVSHHRKATILGRQGNYEQAIGEYAEGIRHLEHLVLGGQWEFCFGLANMMANQGYCLLRVGKRTESQRVLRNTLQVIDKGLRNTNDARLLALRHQVQSMF